MSHVKCVLFIGEFQQHWVLLGWEPCFYRRKPVPLLNHFTQGWAKPSGEQESCNKENGKCFLPFPASQGMKYCLLDKWHVSDISVWKLYKKESTEMNLAKFFGLIQLFALKKDSQSSMSSSFLTENSIDPQIVHTDLRLKCLFIWFYL